MNAPMHLFSAGYSKTICGSTKVSKENRDENSSTLRHDFQELTRQIWDNNWASGWCSTIQQEHFSPCISLSPCPIKQFLIIGLGSFSWEKSSSELLISFKKGTTARHKCKAGEIGFLYCLKKKDACSRQVKRRDTVILTTYSNVLESPLF